MSETLEAYAGDTNSEPSQAASAATRVRRRSTIDVAGQTVTVIDVDGAEQGTYSAAGLPQPVKDYLVVFGMWVFLRNQADIPAMHRKLLAGHVPAPRQASAGPKLSEWRQAIALALVEATKKAPEPLTLDQAKAKAVAFSREALIQAKVDPVVLKHYNKLTGKSADAGVLSLLDV